MKYTINAEGKSIGRIATEAAVLLMGKNRSDFKKNAIPAISIEVTNVSKSKLTGAKMDQKTYSRYSGYPGGLKQPTARRVAEKKGQSELLRHAVSGMLPKNKLREKMMKNLKITE